MAERHKIDPNHPNAIATRWRKGDAPTADEVAADPIPMWRRMRAHRAAHLKAASPDQTVQLMEMLFRCAMGEVEWSIEHSDGSVRTYRGKPDMAAARLWIEYTVGLPKRDEDLPELAPTGDPRRVRFDVSFLPPERAFGPGMAMTGPDGPG